MFSLFGWLAGEGVVVYGELQIDHGNNVVAVMLGGGWWWWHSWFNARFPWSAVPDPLCGLDDICCGVGSVHVSSPEQVVEVVCIVAGVGGVESSHTVAVVVHEFDDVLVVTKVGVAADTVGGGSVFADGVFGGDGFGVFCVGDDGCGGGAYCL